MNLRVDAFYLYGESANRQEAMDRQAAYMDMQAAIGNLFSGKKKDEYLKELQKLSE